MTADVHQFAYGRLHPQLGDKVTCARQRWHAGEHRAEGDDMRLRVWQDPPADGPVRITGAGAALWPDPHDGPLEEASETFTATFDGHAELRSVYVFACGWLAGTAGTLIAVVATRWP